LALAAAGCPDREVGIAFSAPGAGLLSGACTANIDPCSISVRSNPDLQGRAFNAQLFLLSSSDETVRGVSKCMTVAPCSDPKGHNACLADALNQELDGAIPGGLGFDGLEEPNQAQLFLAIYQPFDPASTNPPCTADDLVACAGLALPGGKGTFDISCASCQGGSKTPPGRENTPCNARSCFLKTCSMMIQGNNAQ
jgi:hypothetical protein